MGTGPASFASNSVTPQAQAAFNQTKSIWYNTIQSAINAADPSDVINIASGTFYERLTINKALTLNGDTSTTTIIDGQELGNPITVNASNVNITNLTVQHTFPDSASAGIWADSGHSALYISDVISRENTGGGFHLRADHSTLRNCIATDNIWGIRIDYTNNFTVDNCDSYDNRRTDPELPLIQGQGIRVVAVTDSTFSNLDLYGNAWEGFYVGADGPSVSSGITISNNNIHDNGQILPSVGVGVNIQTATNVLLKDSAITNNPAKGVYEVSSQGTIIDNNTISGSGDNNIYSLQSTNGIIRNNTIS